MRAWLSESHGCLVSRGENARGAGVDRGAGAHTECSPLSCSALAQWQRDMRVAHSLWSCTDDWAKELDEASTGSVVSSALSQG